MEFHQQVVIVMELYFGQKIQTLRKLLYVFVNTVNDSLLLKSAKVNFVSQE